jgi:hypothetical protein
MLYNTQHDVSIFNDINKRKKKHKRKKELVDNRHKWVTFTYTGCETMYITVRKSTDNK